MVVDPGVLLKEPGLEERDVDTTGLMISADAHLLMPYHVATDKVTERFLVIRRSVPPAAASTVLPGQDRPRRRAGG